MTAGIMATGSVIATDIDSTTLTYALVTNGTKGVATINAATGALHIYGERRRQRNRLVPVSESKRRQPQFELAMVTITIWSGASESTTAGGRVAGAPAGRSV